MRVLKTMGAVVVAVFLLTALIVLIVSYDEIQLRQSVDVIEEVARRNYTSGADTTKAVTPGRFQIVFRQGVARDTWLVDTQSGNVWLLTRSSLPLVVWQPGELTDPLTKKLREK